MRVLLAMFLLASPGVACGPKTGGATDAGESSSTSSNPTSGVVTTGEPGTGEAATDASTSSTSSTSSTEATTAADTGTGMAATGDATTGGAMLPPCGPVEQSDEFSISNAVLVGDSLVVDLSYSGGCEAHDFVLCFDGYIIEEGWRAVRLEHDAHGDACKAGIEEQRSFDLTPLQEEQSPLEFVLDGWGDLFVYEY